MFISLVTGAVIPWGKTLDIGGTSVKTAITDKKGNIYEQSSINIPKTLYEFTKSIFEYIKNVKVKISFVLKSVRVRLKLDSL